MIAKRLRMYRWLPALALLAIGGFSANDASAQSLNCSTAYQVVQTFANGAKWEMCWERRDREGIVLLDINYTTIDGDRRKVLYQANVAQIHVPYDDDGARYHDVSDFGLGFPQYLNDLTPADCPGGTLLQEGTKDVICKTLKNRGPAVVQPAGVASGEALVLFSVSHVGAYNYIPEWRFFDDGTIEPAMGATGRLQRYTNQDQYGWPVRGGSTPIGVSHLHNYYWRLDFDLNTSSGADSNDIFEEIDLVADPLAPQNRETVVTRMTTEAARSVDPEKSRFWVVRDGDETNADNLPISYEIRALDTGHRDTGPTFEPWTFDDIYVTTYRDCEKFVSHNPAATGCIANGSVTDFVSGENLVDGDLVVWFGLTFHHIPRDEDESYMHAHWNHFQIAPRDWTAGTLGVDINSPPELDPIGAQTGFVGDVVSLFATATDPEGTMLSYSEGGLPDGLSLNATTGEISGTLTLADNFQPTISVTDIDGASDSETFSWDVSTPGNNPPQLTNPGAQTGGVGIPVNLQIQASDIDGDTLAYSDSGLPDGLAIDAVSGVISGIPSVAGNFSATVAVVDGNGGSDSVSFTWSINGAPNLTSPGDQMSKLGVAVDLQLVASDPNGDTLTFSEVGLPSGLSMSTSGQVTGVPDTLEAPTVTVTVSDGNGGQDQATFVWTIFEGCADCVDFSVLTTVSMGNQDRDANVTVLDGGEAIELADNTWRRTEQTFTITPDTVLEFTFESAQEGEVHGIGFDENTQQSADRVFRVYGNQGNPWGIGDFANYSGSGPQTYTIPVGQYFTGANMYLVLVNDNDAGSGNNSIFRDVRVYTPGQEAPVITAPADQTTTLGNPVNLQVSATDANGDALTFSATGLPAGLDIDTDGLITGIPTTEDEYTVTVSVTDGIASDSAAFMWTVEVDNTPLPPVLTNPGAQTSKLGVAVDLQLVASDPNGDTLTFSEVGLPSGLSMSTSGQVTGVPDTLEAPTVTVTVSDGNGGQDQASFVWTISEGCSDCLDFSVLSNVSMGNQDRDANVTVLDGGEAIELADNTWRRTEQTFSITADTVLEFTFDSSQEGEVHGIGFDEDTQQSANRVFRVWGNQGNPWGIDDFANYSGSGPQTYTIPVGQYFTGTDMYLVLVNDNDAGSGNNSIFRDVRLYEASN